MRSILVFFLSVSILTLSCKRDEEPTSYTFHFTIQGALFNSQTGNVIPDQQISFFICPPAYPKTITTDQYGVFHLSWTDHRSGGSYLGPNSGTPCYLYCCADSVAALIKFKYGDLVDNGVNNFSIYAEPVGYLALTLSDTSLAPSCTILIYNNIAGYQTFGWQYNAQQNGYADTTRILKVYGNTIVAFHLDSIFVPRNDTVHKTIYF